MVLGIETATSVCGASVVANGSVVSEEWLDERFIHAEKLLPMVDTVMRRAGCALADLAGVAVSIGPGSFTGLRIGLSVAKGLVYGQGLPLVAVPTLEALASRAAGAGEAREFVLPLLDSRREELYCQLFRNAGGALEAVWTERSRLVADLIADIGDRPVTVTGDGSAKLADFLAATVRVQDGQFHFVPPPAGRCSAGTIGILGERRLAEGKIENPSMLEPRYIKEFSLKAV